MTKKDHVLFVVLNFNGWVETLTCIETILAQTYKKFHILLIDNGSADESLKKLSAFEKEPKITFIKQPVNLGFAGGVNIGIRYAIKHNYSHAALVNNDALLTNDWLKNVMSAFKRDSSIGIAPGSLIHKNHLP